MLEQLAVWLGRNVEIRGNGRALATLFALNHHTRRHTRDVYTCGDGLSMKLSTRNWIDWNILFRSDVELQLTRLLLRLAPRGDGFVDIRANVDTHTLACMESLGPKCSALSFRHDDPRLCVRGFASNCWGK
jgi:hypothetical protein